MPIPAPADAKGSTFTFSGFSANIITIDPPGMTRAAIEVTHLGTSQVKNYIPAKLAEAGDVSITFEFDPSQVPPILNAAASLSIYFASSVPQTWTWTNAFMTAYNPESLEVGKKFVAKATFKLPSFPTIS